MTRLELRVLIAAILAASVVLCAVLCVAYGQAAIAAALAIYALVVGAWLYTRSSAWCWPAASTLCVRRSRRCGRCSR